MLFSREMIDCKSGSFGESLCWTTRVIQGFNSIQKDNSLGQDFECLLKTESGSRARLIRVVDAQNVVLLEIVARKYEI